MPHTSLPDPGDHAPRWIRNDWTGQQHRPPRGLPPDALVEVELRDGERETNIATRFVWSHTGSEIDILRYRHLHWP